MQEADGTEVDVMRYATQILALVLVPTLAPAAGPAEPLVRLTGVAVDFGSGLTGRARTASVDVVIERWSTPEELDRFTNALREKGPDGLLSALRDVDRRVGYVRAGQGLGYPLRLAQEKVYASGARRIVVATDRPISVLEYRSHARTLDYPFLMVDVRLDAGGRGEGKLLPAARVAPAQDNVFQFEDYDVLPVRLLSVHTLE